MHLPLDPCNHWILISNPPLSILCAQTVGARGLSISNPHIVYSLRSRMIFRVFLLFWSQACSNIP